VSEWQPIETAPKDGRLLRLRGRRLADPDYISPIIVMGHYDSGGRTEGWETESGAWFVPAEWQPLPETDASGATAEDTPTSP
jgi:hypothetical protein